MSSGRSHSDADLEAWQITQSPPQFIDPGFTRHSWLCAGGHGAVDKPAPAPSSVGAGLPAMAVGQSIHPAMTLRHREQARSYKCCYRPSSVGAGLPAMAVGQSIHPAMTLRHREQARSYKCCYRPSSVGAGLPAMAVGQSIHPAMTLRHREASSLLRWGGCDADKPAPTNAAITLWELACQRWRWVSQYIRQ